MAHDEPAPPDEGTDEDQYYVLEVGGFGGVVLRLLKWFRRPVVRGGNPTGFYTTRYVAARSRLEAEAPARAHVIREWQGLSLMSHFAGVDDPAVEATDPVEIEGWFWRNGGQGFSLFRHDDADASPSAARAFDSAHRCAAVQSFGRMK